MSRAIFKIITKNAPFKDKNDYYHYLLKIKWPTLLLYYVTFFLIINVFFGTIYSLDPNALSIKNASFLKCFFFSVQTFSTVGYGTISPDNLFANIVVVVEILTGLVTIAMMTGLVFAKFSRPSGRIIFTNNILINQFNNEKVLTFRCANARNNQIISTQIEVNLLYYDKSIEGHSITRFVPLKLQKDYIPLFTLSWSVFHTIDESSPLFNITTEEMMGKKFEFIILIKGTDQTFSQNIHQVHYYAPGDIQYNKYFKDILSRLDDGTRIIDYKYFNELN